jgi:sensor histidine kinase YesM
MKSSSEIRNLVSLDDPEEASRLPVVQNHVMNRLHKRNVLQVIIHCGSWLIVLGVPFLFTIFESDRDIHRYLNYFVPMVGMVGVFYLNFFYLIEKYIFNKKIGLFLLANLVLFVVVSTLLFFIHEAFLQIPDLNFHRREIPLEFLIIRDLGTFILVTGISVAVRMTSQWYKAESQRKDLEKAHVESELSNLKHQLSPHFLFNTLNNIYALIAIDPENAQEAIHRLSKLIRYVLYTGDQEQVPVNQEIGFLRNYIDLMSLRLPPEVKLENTFIESEDEKMIAPLLFIALIENAFKHSVSPPQEAFIRIRLDAGTNHKVICQMENSYHPKSKDDRSGAGIGLANLRKRLELIYPSKYELLTENKGDTFYSTLIINL